MESCRSLSILWLPGSKNMILTNTVQVITPTRKAMRQVFTFFHAFLVFFLFSYAPCPCVLVVRGATLGTNQSERSKFFLDQSESRISPMWLIDVTNAHIWAWFDTWPHGIKNTRTQELNLHCLHSFNDRVEPGNWTHAQLGPGRLPCAVTWLGS